ncbi:chaplin family protein [Streptomyces sp. NPDC020883]|uniref:chaplin family protein n=1 Tax=unclassified Streptomyces TaxID=2593676 RepID=UPI0034E1CF60
MRRSLKACVLAVAVSGVLGAGAGPSFAGAGGPGGAVDGPGALAGNAVRVEVHAPFTVCGNSLVVVGVLNSGTGDRCGNGPAAGRAVPVRRAAEPTKHRRRAAGGPARTSRLHTGARSGHDPRVGAVARAGRSAGKALLAASGAERLEVAAATGGGLLVAGAALLRRARRRQG